MGNICPFSCTIFFPSIGVCIPSNTLNPDCLGFKRESPETSSEMWFRTYYFHVVCSFPYKESVRAPQRASSEILFEQTAIIHGVAQESQAGRHVSLFMTGPPPYSTRDTTLNRLALCPLATK